MIHPPQSWRRHFGANLTSLYPPKGGGRIRYYERVAPLRRFSGLIRYALDRDPDFIVGSIDKPREIISSEGEYGAWVEITGIRDRARVSRFVGALFADDFASVIDAMAVLAPSRGLIETTAQNLLVNARLGRGVCQRRFRYSAPLDWQAVPTGLVANWYPPDFPSNNTNIVVLPAQPIERSATEEIEAMIAAEQRRGVEVSDKIAEAAIEARSGLAGRRWMFSSQQPGRDEPLFRDFIVFEQEPYQYTIRMESLTADRIEEHRAIVGAIARSVEPIPQPASRIIGPTNPESTTGAFGHWLD